MATMFQENKGNQVVPLNTKGGSVAVDDGDTPTLMTASKVSCKSTWDLYADQVKNSVDQQLKRDEKFWVRGTPHLIGTSLQVNYIKGIDTVNQQFEAGFYISYEFLPSESDIKTFAAAKKEGRLSEWVPDFIPQFNFPNAFEFIEKENRQYLDGSFFSLVKNGEPDTLGALLDMPYDYIIAARMSVRGVFGEPFELHDFPFDCQELQIVIQSVAGADVQILVPHFRIKCFVNISQDVSTFPEWKVHKPVVDLNISDPRKSGRGLSFSTFNLILKFERISRAYLLRVYSQLALITMTGFTMFAMDPAEDLADRLATAFTLLLTAVAFMFVIEGKLPNVPYMTCIDYYVVVSFVFLLVLAGYAALVNRLLPIFGTGSENLELIIMQICAGIWVFYNFIFAVLGCRAKSKNVSFLKQVRPDFEEDKPAIKIFSRGSNLPGEYWGDKIKKGLRRGEVDTLIQDDI